MEQKGYYLTKIKDDLSLRQRQNPHYSRGLMPEILGPSSYFEPDSKKERPLPVKDSRKVIEKMNLGPKERTLFIESLMRNKICLDQIEVSENDDRFMLDESYYKGNR